MELHSDKRALVAGVLAGMDAAALLSTMELLSLLAGSATPGNRHDEKESPTRSLH